jgi:dihydrofolate reductase
MGRIVVQTHVTLDGVVESPPEALPPYMSDAGRQATLELALASDALLLGRVTWQRLGPAWREQTGPTAERLNTIPKYVVSSTLGSADGWGDSEVVGYSEVAVLREQLDLILRPPATDHPRWREELVGPAAGLAGASHRPSR